MTGQVERAMDAVLKAYAAMSIEGGYGFDCKLATRHIRNPRDLTTDQLVPFMVTRAPGQRSPILYIGNETYKQLVQVDVLSYVQTEGTNVDTFGLATQAEALISDMKRLALADVHFGAPDVIRDSRILYDSHDAGWEDDGAAVNVGLQLDVIWNAAAPP